MYHIENDICNQTNAIPNSHIYISVCMYTCRSKASSPAAAYIYTSTAIPQICNICQNIPTCIYTTYTYIHHWRIHVQVEYKDGKDIKDNVSFADFIIQRVFRLRRQKETLRSLDFTKTIWDRKLHNEHDPIVKCHNTLPAFALS